MWRAYWHSVTLLVTSRPGDPSWGVMWPTVHVCHNTHLVLHWCDTACRLHLDGDLWHGWLIRGDSVVSMGIFMGLGMVDSSVVTKCMVSIGIFMGLDIWLTHRWWLSGQHGHLHLVLPLPLHPPPWITLRCTLPRHGTRHGWLISRDQLSGQHGHLHGTRHGWLISGDSVVNVGIFMGLDMADSSVMTRCTWSMLVSSWDLSHGWLITGD